MALLPSELSAAGIFPLACTGRGKGMRTRAAIWKGLFGFLIFRHWDPIGTLPALHPQMGVFTLFQALLQLELVFLGSMTYQ